MHTTALIAATLPLAACGLIPSAGDTGGAATASVARTVGTASVTIPVPTRTEPATAPGGVDATGRFRADFARRSRFVTVPGGRSRGAYVLDRSSGCAYHVDARGGRSPVLAEDGRPDCTYHDG